MRPRPQRKIGIQQDGAATALIGSDAVQKNIHPFLSHPVQSVLKFFYLIFFGFFGSRQLFCAG